MLKGIVPRERFVEELLALLDQFDTEYMRNVEPKVQLLAMLEEHPSEDVRVAVEPFLDDASETVRFTAVNTTFAMNDETQRPGAGRRARAEESPAREKSHRAGACRARLGRARRARRSLLDSACTRLRAAGRPRRSPLGDDRSSPLTLSRQASPARERAALLADAMSASAGRCCSSRVSSCRKREVPVGVVDLVVGELLVLAAARGVEAAGVPGEGQDAPLEADGAPLVDVEA